MSDKACGTNACKWLLLLVVIGGFAALYNLLNTRLIAPEKDVASCGAQKEIGLDGYGRVISLNQEGNLIHLVTGNVDEGVYNAVTIDICDNKAKSKITIRTK